MSDCERGGDVHLRNGAKGLVGRGSAGTLQIRGSRDSYLSDKMNSFVSVDRSSKESRFSNFCLPGIGVFLRMATFDTKRDRGEVLGYAHFSGYPKCWGRRRELCINALNWNFRFGNPCPISGIARPLLTYSIFLMIANIKCSGTLKN